MQIRVEETPLPGVWKLSFNRAHVPECIPYPDREMWGYNEKLDDLFIYPYNFKRIGPWKAELTESANKSRPHKYIWAWITVPEGFNVES